MKTSQARRAALRAASVAIVAFAAGYLLRSPGDSARVEAQAKAPDPAAMMKAMIEAATPGETHKKLARFAGDWDARTEMFDGSAPGGIKGSCTITSVLGGRFIQIVEKGVMGGQPVESIVFSGYDNVTREHVSCNMSTMGTGIYTAAGSEKDGVTTLRGLMCDFMSPKKPGRPYRIVITDRSTDHFEVEVFDSVPPEYASEQVKAGTEVPVMKTVYTRRAGAEKKKD